VRKSTPLSGRVALVTGVSRRIGIGFTLVSRLLADGATVLATGWRPHDEEMPWGPGDKQGAELLAELGEPASRLQFVAEDLEDPDAPERLMTSAVDRFGQIDIVVANHARSSHDSIWDVSAQELDRCWAINARASMLLARSLARAREPGPGGRVVLFTSDQHRVPMWTEIAYSISKGAIHQMTLSLAAAMTGQGITVNCINPGPVDTGYASGEEHARVARHFPSGHWGEPDDVARLIAWLVGDEGRWITGQVINNDGGFRLV